MGKAMLRDFFSRASAQRRALEAYGGFAKGTAWSVPTKMELYAASQLAFGSRAPEDERLRAFEAIYANLVSYWQVFRPHGADECWPARQIFHSIRAEFGPFSWEAGIGLPGFLSSGRHGPLLLSLLAMAGIKPNAGYPTMTVSKFLHFYNPALFPIYDTEVVWNRVFGRFKADYREFRDSANLKSGLGEAAFLRNYVCWSGSLMDAAHADFMRVFADWLRDELPPKAFAKLGVETVTRLYATAFEFTAIGAAVVEGA